MFARLIIAALLLLTIPAANAQEQPPRFMTQAQLAAQQTVIRQVEHYLSSLTTIVSDFSQVAPDGALTTGKFYLQRPGKMRWQYNPPTPILMVSNGSELVYYDYELDQISHIPLDSTLIGFLARDKITFSDTVGITELTETPGAMRISLRQKEKPTDGELTLEFTANPMQLRNMVVRDATGQVTTVSLNNARFDVKLDKELFIFREPGKRKRVGAH